MYFECLFRLYCPTLRFNIVKHLLLAASCVHSRAFIAAVKLDGGAKIVDKGVVRVPKWGRRRWSQCQIRDCFACRDNHFKCDIAAAVKGA